MKRRESTRWTPTVGTAPRAQQVPRPPFLPLYTRGDIRKMSKEAQAFYNEVREVFSDRRATHPRSNEGDRR